MYIGERLKEIQAEWEAEISSKIMYLHKEYEDWNWPQLSIILASDDKASLSYVRAKMKKLQELNIDVSVHCLPIDCDLAYAENRVREIARRSNAVIIQSPTHFSLADTQKLMNLVPYKKDADRLSYESFGAMLANTAESCAYPATVRGIIEIINNTMCEESYDEQIGKKAVIIGRGQLVGAPMAIALRDHFNMSVTEFHSYSKDMDIRSACYDADLIISASNQYLTVLEDQTFKKDKVYIIDAATIVDNNGKIKGSIPESVALQNNTLVTPVPGGVGPFTVLGLASNTVYLALQQFREE